MCYLLCWEKRYIYAIAVLKTAFTIIADLYLIPKFGVNGAAYSNIAVNTVCVVLCLNAIFKEKLNLRNIKECRK